MQVLILSPVLNGIHTLYIEKLVDLDGAPIRTGHHSAQPVMDRFCVAAMGPPSLAMYNTRADLETLARAIRRVQAVFR
jgi:cysteine desulfurase/selenocysteine lyase